MEQLEQIPNGLQFGELTAYWIFLNSVGCSRTTGWRWRTNKWIETVTIAGRPYVRREAIDKFLMRAQAGEFAKNPAGAAGAAGTSSKARLEKSVRKANAERAV
jgi:hypothetical protein